MLRIFGGRRSSAASLRDLSSAGSIINTSGFRFWIGTALVGNDGSRRRAAAVPAPSGFDDELSDLIRATPIWRERDELLRSVPEWAGCYRPLCLPTCLSLGTLTRKQIAALVRTGAL